MFSLDSMIEEIKNKQNYLKRDRLRNMLDELFASQNYLESTQHSARLAAPLADLFKNECTDKEKETRLNTIEKYHLCIRRAWEMGIKRLVLPFDELFLKTIAGLISGFGLAEYRSNLPYGVRPSDSEVTPPYPAKVPLEMNKFFERLNLLYQKITESANPALGVIDLSSWVHLHLTRIHPFEDGNGRTARLIQNLMLYKNEFPPVTIQEGERADYHSHLERAIIGYKNREGHNTLVTTREELSEAEQELYDYFTGRVNVAIDRYLKKH